MNRWFVLLRAASAVALLAMLWPITNDASLSAEYRVCIYTLAAFAAVDTLDDVKALLKRSTE